MNQWVQSSVADFSAGTQSNTVVTNAGAGQVQLAQEGQEALAHRAPSGSATSTQTQAS